MNDHRRDIEECLSRLFDVSRAWHECVRVERGVMFCPLTYSALEGSPEYLLRMAVADYVIPSHSENGSVNRYPGVFSVPSEVIDLTHQLNTAKMALELAVKAGEASGMDSLEIRSIYRQAGHPRLHPKQAWRQVVVLDGEGLQSVGFTVAKYVKSSEVISAADATEWLVNNGAFDIAGHIASNHAQSVRVRRPVAPHIRANVVWGAKEDRRSRMIYASLPILIPEGTWPQKRVRFNQPREHAKRNDYTIESTIPVPFRSGCSITLC